MDKAIEYLKKKLEEPARVIAQAHVRTDKLTPDQAIEKLAKIVMQEIEAAHQAGFRKGAQGYDGGEAWESYRRGINKPDYLK